LGEALDMHAVASTEFLPITAADTHGILLRSEHTIHESSDSLGWTTLYASRQHERPYSAEFASCHDHLIVIHLSGPVNVERQLSGERHRTRIQTGGMFVLPGGRDFGVKLCAPLETIHLYIKGDLLTAAAGELCQGDPEGIELLPRMGERDPLIEHLGRMACAMMADRQTDFFADGLARVMAAQLVRHHSTGVHAPLSSVKGLSSQQLAAVRELIEEQMEQPLRIDDLANAAGLSAMQFARQFKISTSKTPHQYLIEARVARARTLLQGRTSIAQIAFECGFSHQEHLTRTFGRQLGVTPAAYRRNALS
jgi:AraC family transcriptional regulator